MRLLLDTHAFLWWVTADDKLSAKARRAIADMGNEIFVSAASAWEIATQNRLGRQGDAGAAVPRFAELVAAEGFSPLAVDHRHALLAGGYDLSHRDPFDRMLAAQSEIERLPLVTLDPAFALFGTRTVW